MTLGKIIEIVNLFQDSGIDGMSQVGDDLNVKLDCEFLASIIDKNFKSFYAIFKSCNHVYFEPWEQEDLIISDLKEINSLQMKIINAERYENGFLKIYVNCRLPYKGGNLMIKSDDLIIYDEDFIEKNLISLTELSERYWFSSDKAEG
jgi:hypothetical protein